MVCFLSREIQCQSTQLTKKGVLSMSHRRTLGPGLFASKQAQWKSHIIPRLGVKDRRPLRKTREASCPCVQTLQGTSTPTGAS